MSLNALAKMFQEVSVAHGFSTGSGSRLETIEKLILAIGEISEAVEELRAGHHPQDIYYNPEKPDKPEGFPIEIADTIIRLLQLSAALDIDVDMAVALKNEYNKSRPYKHGKQF